MPSTSDSHRFHPELRSARWLPRGIAFPWLIWLSRRLPMPTVQLPDGVTLSRRNLETSGAASVDIITPSGRSTKRPALLWIHGGGYMIGSAKQDHALCARLAQRLDMVVVAVEYRLAPEHPYPMPLEDCFAAFELMHHEADTLGIDSSRIVIGGASAGGGLAAALTLLVHDRKRPAPLLQLLVYPMLDDRTIGPSVERGFHRIWNRASNERGWRSYLGTTPGGDDTTEYAAPARRRNLEGLPPAWIGVGTLDLFHDEDLAYEARLRAAGVQTTLDVVEGAFHGFDVLRPHASVSRRFFEAQVQAIARQLDRAAIGNTAQPR